MSLYLWINILSFIGPFLLSFDKKVHFYTKWKTILPAILIVGCVFITWDVFFTAHGIWGFHDNYLSGIHLFNLPIEECLFFFTVPYACLFIYEVIKAYFPKFKGYQLSYLFALAFTLVAVILAIIYMENWYTFSALLSAGLINWIVYFGYTPKWYSYFLVAFIITQIPFLLVNGILTGAVTENPVVWYNENHIIGLRIFTIPIEDVFYNFTMLFPIVVLHEYFDKRLIKSKIR
jgi:lycopene cyclase domain-containing protein